ncbi:KAP family P-loop domain-containing protein [Paenibacillus macquariensis]|uniref:KAP family P-loop domain-containing protein n=2 Tax=Paenibacillus macquariensis TaxID=948756 RepID=A0ABY1KDH5_9BACL|nr:KAP family P-loop domain-containing protein [Paenibacillus macquariensis]
MNLLSTIEEVRARVFAYNINYISSNVFKYWLYGLGSVMSILLIGIYFLQGMYNQDKKNEIFNAKSDYLFFVIPFSLIINYIFVVQPITYWTGDLLSDLFNSDNPIKGREDDKLERNKFTDRIAECIANQGNESLTIGIFGEWGSRKSSVYSMIKTEVENIMQNHCIVFDFKPWYFGQENHEIIRTFLFQLSDVIKKDEGFDPKLDKELKKYLEYLSTISLRPTGSMISFKDLLDKYSPSKDSVKLSDVKQKIEDMLQKSDKRIIVFIDDVDRLDRDEIKMVFKLVRLIADFPNITYLLALDEEVVSDSLSEIYDEGSSEIRREQGRRYLDKFIQIPLYLPIPDQQKVSELCWQGIEPFLIEHGIINIEKELLPQHIRHLVFTPRNVFRFINLAKFFIPLLKEEVNTRDLLYLLLIQISSPKLYKFISENGLVLINDVEEKDLGNVREQFNNMKLGGFNRYANLLSDLFPYSEKLCDRKIAKISTQLKQSWFNEKRICSETYFNQYFMYSLPKGEVSHENLELFIMKLSDINTSFDDLYQDYIKVIKLHSINDVNIKLESKL